MQDLLLLLASGEAGASDQDYSAMHELLITTGEDDTWRKAGFRINLQLMFQKLHEVWIGNHDRVLKSVCANFPDGSYKTRIADSRITQLFGQDRMKLIEDSLLRGFVVGPKKQEMRCLASCQCLLYH